MVRRPILGFGWGGAAAAAVLFALAWAHLSGADLRSQLMRAILELGGIQAVYDFVIFGLIAHHFAAMSAVFSLVSLCVLLPGMHLDPRPGFARRACLVGAWAVLAPVLWYRHLSGHLPFDPLFGMLAKGPGAAVLTTALTAAVLWLATRSLWVVGLAVGGAALSLSMDDLPLQLPLMRDYSHTATWNAAMGVALVVVARRRRARCFAEGACHACGYDLAGLPHPGCPECGADQAAPPA